MSVTDLTLSQVFCSDVLFFLSCHQLCVNQGFLFVGSSSIVCLLERIKWPKSPLFLLMGLFLRLSAVCILSASSTASSVFVLLLSASLHFLSVAILSSESPSRVCPIHFLFLFLSSAFIKALSSPILSIISIICFIFCLTESLYSPPCSDFESLLIPASLMAYVSAPCLLLYSLSASVSLFSSDSCLTFDTIVRPRVEDGFFVFLRGLSREF